MTTPYDAAVANLYQAPHGDFVTERKRLADELTRTGDKAGASLLSKHRRPSVSAWATNQLYWQHRDDFETLLHAGERLREGDLAATAEHRRALSGLTTLATELLAAAGHGSNEGTLRRVTANLSALAAAGGFGHDVPGALVADRDPPGFEALTNESFPVVDSSAPPSKAEANPDQEAQRATAEERRQKAVEKAQLEAERVRLEGAIRANEAHLSELQAQRDQLERALASANAERERTETILRELRERLARAGVVPPTRPVTRRGGRRRT